MESLTLVISPQPLASGATVHLDVINNPFGGLTTSGVAILQRQFGQEWVRAFRLDSRRGDRPPAVQPLGASDRLRIEAIARHLPLEFVLPTLEPGSYKFVLAVGVPSDTGPYRKTELDRAFEIR